MEDIKEFILRNKIIAIIRGLNSKECINTAKALYDGGINLVEVTFDQKSHDNYKQTTDAISGIAEKFDGMIAVGAGTVMTLEQLELAAKAGARYIISPDSNQNIIKKTKELGLISMPGAFSPTEVVCAYNWGADFVKLFPANILGIDYIKAVCAPISHIPIMAVGGVNKDNIKSYLDAGCVGAGVGSCLFNKEYIKKGYFNKITQAAKDMCNVIKL
jgi:2-dehydro-3-deoxyphosphogluconate aldolase/(4S)-4-hydroxy-2-oxoglutarate aldolase